MLAETTAELTDALRQTLICPEVSQDPAAARGSVAFGMRISRAAPGRSAAAR